MMSRICRYILYIVFLITVFDLRIVALADETATDQIIARPIVEYKSHNLRDPFMTYLIKAEPKVALQSNTGVVKPIFDLTKLKVQGIIWGVKTPQAIINDQIFTVGELIEGAEILSIEKKGITLSFNGEILDLIAPGQDAVFKGVE